MIIRHISRQHSLRPLLYVSRAFQRQLRGGRPALTQANNFFSSRPAWERPREKDERDEVKVGFLPVIGLILVYGVIITNIPSWDETLDAICRIVPPKTVSSSASLAAPSTTYGPIHQDPPSVQPITRSDEFRVLVIEPGSGNEQVRCRLINVASSWRTRYDALSYTWGDSTPETIIVDGLRTGVTKNLHSALMHLRNTGRRKMLWVDALCINQADIEERDEQVKKMGSIYSKARQVIIWLGEQTQEVQEAFSILGNTSSVRGSRKRSFSPAAVSGDWSPVFNLLKRPWFQRTWIIQEAVLAREPVLACGPETIPWGLLSDCCSSEDFQDILPDDDKELAQGLKAVGLIAHGRHEHHTKYVTLPKRRGQKHVKKKKYTPNFKLASTLYATRGFQCIDERDKLFGVLSLATNIGPEDKEVLGPNYRASVEEVYETVAQWDITKNRSLELLSYCSRREWRHPSLPSWAPDFSDIDESHPMPLLRVPEPKLGFFTSLIRRILPRPKLNPGFQDGHEPSFVKENGKTVLVLSGEIVDAVTEVGAVTEIPRMIVHTNTEEKDQESARLDMDIVSKRRKWLEECARMAVSADPNSQKVAKDAVVCWKSDNFGMSQKHYDRFERAMGRFGAGYVRFIFEGINDAQWLQQWKGNSRWERVDKHLRDLVYKRRFCVAQTGSMGWVPGATKPGDLVCRISGAQVPIIIRRAAGTGESVRYMVVGDAYFSDLMLSSRKEPFYYTGGDRLAII